MSRMLLIEFGKNPGDHRPLGLNDTFLSGSFSESQVAHFITESAALAALARATNRRAGLVVSIIGSTKKVTVTS